MNLRDIYKSRTTKLNDWVWVIMERQEPSWLQEGSHSLRRELQAEEQKGLKDDKFNCGSVEVLELWDIQVEDVIMD